MESSEIGEIMIKDEVRSFSEIRIGFFRNTTPLHWVIFIQRFEET
jgi:hypothetical protein